MKKSVVIGEKEGGESSTTKEGESLKSVKRWNLAEKRCAPHEYKKRNAIRGRKLDQKKEPGGKGKWAYDFQGKKLVPRAANWRAKNSA